MVRDWSVYTLTIDPKELPIFLFFAFSIFLRYKSSRFDNPLIMTTKENLITRLNTALEAEYGAAIQYITHAAMMTGPEYDSIIKELLIHSQEEMQHAVTLSEQIVFLGGTPSMDVKKRHTSNDSQEMLEYDLKGEENAIIMYKDLIKQAESLQEYGLRRILEDILIMEEEHKRDLMTSLNK